MPLSRCTLAASLFRSFSSLPAAFSIMLTLSPMNICCSRKYLNRVNTVLSEIQKRARWWQFIRSTVPEKDGGRRKDQLFISPAIRQVTPTEARPMKPNGVKRRDLESPPRSGIAALTHPYTSVLCHLYH